MKTRCVVVLAASLVLLTGAVAPAALQSFITMTNGYFCEAGTGKPWIPHGVAYQTWNRPLGVWQTRDQIDYDLDEMVKMGANSIRVDFVWQHIEEKGDNVWSWDNYDYLVQACEQRGIRIFALIGYQWPPNWFPNEWYTMHPPEIDSTGIEHTNRWQSDIIGYETPEARAQYAEFFSNVCARYKDSKAIVAWIVGNEYGYLGLWSGLLDGYDPQCEQAFRTWCQARYTNIASANAAWGTGYTNFNQLTFPDQYRAYGVEGAIWADAVQWREESIANFTAMGAKAARAADTNHLLSYSTVGMQWGEEDWRYHAEDRGKITAACAASNAPLGFFSVNNYPWSVLGHESQNGQWGVSFTKKVTGVPVVYTETGFSSSETMWPGMNEMRQGPLIRNSLWESLECGAIGMHIFTWMDRMYITDREKGFGVLYADRNVKQAFWDSRDTYMLMEQVKIHSLFSGSKDPKPDIAFLWTSASDSQYNRYECEMQQIAGALERLGYEPNFIDLQDLASGVYTNYKLIILPRNMRVDNAVPGHTNSVLNFLLKQAIPKGIHVLATADLPGLQNPNGKPRAAFTNEAAALFGVNAANVGGYEIPQRRRHYVSWYWKLIGVTFNSNAVGPVTNSYHYWPFVWKYSEEIEPTNGGTVWATMDTYRNRGFEGSKTYPKDWDGWWGDGSGMLYITNWAGFAYDGTNFAGMWGDAGLYKDFPVVPFGRYSYSTFLRSNAGDPLRDGSRASIGIEWTDEDANWLGVSEAPLLVTNTPGDAWVKYTADALAPSNAWRGRAIIRVRPGNLVSNAALTGSDSAPAGWTQWGDGSNDPEGGVKLTADGNSWAFWGDAGIQQDVTNGFAAGNTLNVGGWLYTPGQDALRDGTKYGVIQIEFYNGAALLSVTSASPIVNASSTPGVWIPSERSVTVPGGTTRARVIVRCNDFTNGQGRFFADDIYLRNVSRGGGSVFVDHKAVSPAVVVKNHGTAKSAIFLYSAGDMMPDGNLDKDPDTYDWKWRYDVFGAMVRDYFGIQPAVSVQGTNAYLCLPEYRTCADTTTLWQVKNYLYDTNYSNGGASQTFILTSSLFTGKTVRAIAQARVLETNSDGTISLTLPPDGMEMLYVYPRKTNDLICQLADAPAVIHPFGDKNYSIKVKYDTAGRTNLVLKIALVGGAYSNVAYQTIATNVAGAGEFTFWMWIPDASQTDTNYLSTPDGGQYQFTTWLEDPASNRVTDTAAQTTQLKWGVRPTSPLPTNMVKGASAGIPLEWEEMYEYLYWQHSPMARNEAFPTRVAVFRSSKTEAQFPGHFAKVNEVCNWLESLGYENGDLLDIAFDNVMVTTTAAAASAPAVYFQDNVESGTNGWTRDGLWHTATDLYSSATHSWAYNNGTHYNTGVRNSGSLITPLITLTNGATLTFKSWYETEDTGTAWDRKLVYINSTDNTNWVPILQVSAPNKQWTSQSCNLSAYAGRQIRLRFFFDTMDAVYNQFRGWYLDDVKVAAAPTVVTTQYLDTVESGTNSWTRDGLWHQSTWTSASPTRSWAYNNGTNYNTGARNAGSLVSPWVALTNGSGLTLTFRSWYQTEDTGTSWDRKTVLVSTDGTNWTQVLQVYGPPASAWVTQTADLSLYAGRTVKLKFFFDTIDAINNQYRGWYVDDIKVTAEVIVKDGYPAFADSMEYGTNGWAAAGLWHQAKDLYFSPSNSWAYNNGSNYNTGARNYGSLDTPWIDLAAAASAELAFKSWYETEDTGVSWDRKLVYVSTNGMNWTQIHQISGANRAWTAQSVDLSAYAGQRIRLRFYFDTIDAINNNFHGWYVDDVAVTMVGHGVLFFDDFSAGLGRWTRAAGCANWETNGGTLRARRIGNDDNILWAGAAWTNYSVSADFRYNKQGRYFNDAELYLRYQDRDNFVKVLVQDYYGFWRVRYVVRVRTNNLAQGWMHEFSRTNQPVENTWYSLRAECQGTNYTVYFNGQNLGSFSTPTNFTFATGRIALGTKASQLGIWEPQKGYYFIDDDEYSHYTPANQSGQSQGYPLNLDWGYLRTFYGTLILPSTYVMSDQEASNVVTWINAGYYNLIATDGGVARKNETGADDLGRVEGLFGVAPAIGPISGLTKVTLGTNDHYVSQDYAPGAQVSASGSATAWTTVTNGFQLGTVDNGSVARPALLSHGVGPDTNSPAKVFCFNFGADTGGQLTNQFRVIAQRAFEWARGQAHKVVAQLKYVNPYDRNFDFVVGSATGWVLRGTGSTNVTVTLPTDGIMTGTNLYWVIYTYPWDAGYPWGAHDGFYTSDNDNKPVTIPGFGLQIIGFPFKAYAGRAWDFWVAWNVGSSNFIGEYGLKDKGNLTSEDNFNDGNYSGWTVAAHPNISWSVATGALRATVVGATGGYAYITRDGLNVTGRNITVEYTTRFLNGATNGGLVYRGRVLYVNPQLCGWDDTNANFYTLNGPVTGQWQHVRLNIRDGDPYLKSDLFVNDKVVFVNEPIEVTNWSLTTVGFLSSYYTGYTEWDNFRVADEQYTLVTQAVTGVYIPTNAFWPFVPDYDPDTWEHEGTTYGAQYEWYVYLRGGDVHDYKGTEVYFAPRLMVEDAAFPTNLDPGSAVQVPVEWENLPYLPVSMTLRLEDPYLGTNYFSEVFTITNATGSGWFSATVPVYAPGGANYLWVAYMHPTNSPNPFLERIGLDDTFRFNPQGLPVGPETRITVTTAIPGSEDMAIYRDLGLPAGCDVWTWGSGTFNGDYTGETPPEGVECFQTATPSSAGWGVFDVLDTVNMTRYADGFLKFWLKSAVATYVELEGPQGNKRSKTVPSTTNTWKEITIPISDFSGVDLTRIMGFFIITAYGSTTFYVDDVRWTRGVYHVYRDYGIPPECTNFTWSGGAATFNGNYVGETPPEGWRCYQAASAFWLGWGVFKTNTLDMGFYSNGYLRFWVKSTNALKVQLEGPTGTVRTKYISSTAGGWQEFQLALTNWGGVDLARTYGLFSISADTGSTYYVDDVSWVRSTNTTPGTPSEVFYSDEGIPPGTDVFAWWASQYWGHVTATTNDGGFEQSGASGRFPGAGFWQPASAGGSATAQCTSAALRSGGAGLRNKTGSGTSAYWCAPYQEYPAAPEDVFNAQAYISQPSGQGWVGGSEAFIRLSFYDAWYALLSQTSSAVKVTAAAQAWTQCSIPDTKAPANSSFVRFELVVRKPNGSNGVSVADFDDTALRQGNSFNGQYGGDTSPPEGARCFRSYCVWWSGWGVFYTNSTVDLSEYANGYLKFFLKSGGYTKIEIQSVNGGVTNTGLGAWYYPTTNQTGQLEWQHKVIPITNFTGVVLSHIKSPFMATDPTEDQAFYIDYVRWEKAP